MLAEVRDADTWNAFVFEHGPRSGAFLQSWQWGEFQKKAGHEVLRLLDGETGGQFVVNRLPLGQRYLYCPRGPIGVGVEGMLRVAAKGVGATFVRFESATVPKASRPSRPLSPPNTLLTDLTLTYDDLSAKQHPKTRYNVGLAERKGVSIELSSTAWNEAWALFETTAKRGQFRLHPRWYYERMLSVLTTDACRAFLAVARFEGRVIAANIMVDFHGTRTYLHGASANVHRDVMAPFLLHWALMSEAKHRGMHWYDWWGVAPVGAGEDHPWAGITRFKLGFGGERVDYPGTFDLISRPFAYCLYETLRSVRRTLRVP